jgi:hypothetical protein
MFCSSFINLLHSAFFPGTKILYIHIFILHLILYKHVLHIDIIYAYTLDFHINKCNY